MSLRIRFKLLDLDGIDKSKKKLGFVKKTFEEGAVNLLKFLLCVITGEQVHADGITSSRI